MQAPVTVAGRYELGPRVGRGGMADVHRAWDLVLERTVAVKLLRHTLTERSDDERFRSEARMLARLDHPGLVSIYDTGIHQEQPYLVMELVEGSTLATLLTSRRLSSRDSVSIAAALADVLAYVHGRGVTHRDLKPSNVLIDHENHVLLADFGVARSDTSERTEPGTMIGTAAYLSPEQVRAEDATPASDIYALGLLLIECLSGRRVYPGTPDVAALARLLTRPPVDDVPAPLRSLVRAMTATEPADRPGPAAVARGLRGYLGVDLESGTGTIALTSITSAVSPVPPAPRSAEPVTPVIPMAPIAARQPAEHHQGVTPQQQGRRTPLVGWRAGALAGAVAGCALLAVLVLPGFGNDAPTTGPGAAPGVPAVTVPPTADPTTQPTTAPVPAEPTGSPTLNASPTDGGAGPAAGSADGADQGSPQDPADQISLDALIQQILDARAAQRADDSPSQADEHRNDDDRNGNGNGQGDGSGQDDGSGTGSSQGDATGQQSAQQTGQQTTQTSETSPSSG